MAIIKCLLGEWGKSYVSQLILTEMKIELLAVDWPRFIFIQFLWSFVAAFFISKFPCNQKPWWGSPHWPGVFCQRVRYCSLPDRRCNFSCHILHPNLPFKIIGYPQLITSSVSLFIFLIPETLYCSLRSRPMKAVILAFSIFYACFLFKSFKNLLIYAWEAIMTKEERELLKLGPSHSKG